MLFRSRTKKADTATALPSSKSSLVWIEIPSMNLSRAVSFYERLLKTRLELTLLYDRPTALFNKYETGFSGSIVEAKDHKGGAGIRPVLMVPVMHDALQAVRGNGGSVIAEPFILKQKNSNGETILGGNLIDRQIGYLAEICDSEGNRLMLYSHS